MILYVDIMVVQLVIYLKFIEKIDLVNQLCIDVLMTMKLILILIN